MASELKSNLTKINWHAFCFGFAPYVPIIFLFFKSTGLSYTQIGIVSAAQWLAQLIFEVPTGIFADKFGRKTAMLIAALLLTVSYLLFSLGNGFILFIIANTLFGIANSFLSGSDTSFIHDSLKSENKHHEFNKHLGRYYLYFFTGGAIGSLFVSLFPNANYRLYFALAIPFALLSFLTVSSTREPELPAKSEKSEFWKHLSGAFKHILSNSEIAATLVFYLITTLTIQLFFRYMQFLLKDAGVAVKYNGLLFAAFITLAGGVSYAAHGIQNKLGKKFTILFLIFTVVAPLIALSKTNFLYIILPAFVLIELAYGYSRPAINHYFHRLVESHNRATVDSLKSFSVDVSMAVFLPICGLIADRLGMQNMLLMLALFALAILGISSAKLLRTSV